MQYSDLAWNSVLNLSVTLNFWPKGSGVMTVLKKSLAYSEIWFVEVDAKDTYIHAYIHTESISILYRILDMSWFFLQFLRSKVLNKIAVAYSNWTLGSNLTWQIKHMVISIRKTYSMKRWPFYKTWKYLSFGVKPFRFGWQDHGFLGLQKK